MYLGMRNLSAKTDVKLCIHYDIPGKFLQSFLGSLKGFAVLNIVYAGARPVGYFIVI